MAQYPNYPSQPYRGGDLPSMEEVGPPDTRYTSSTAPYYWENGLQRMYGRNLAGDEQTIVQDESSAPAWATKDLNRMAADDDVQGNGIFDPPGTHPNIHPDAGVFSVNYSLPGYHAREIPFSETEVRDVTTGRPIRAVPSGAVAFDSAAQIAFLEAGLYKPPEPIIRAAGTERMRRRSIANVMQNPVPIATGATEEPPSLGKLVLGAAVGGVALGAICGWLSRK